MLHIRYCHHTNAAYAAWVCVYAMVDRADISAVHLSTLWINGHLSFTHKVDKWTAKISSEFICLQWVCTNILGAIYGTFCECAVQLMLITFSKVVKVNFNAI